MSGYFSVKNFEHFQHYKDRSPPWIKFYNALLDDYEFGRLPDASKAHLTAIWLLASRHDNRIPLDPEWVGRRINATEPVNLSALLEAGFIVSDQERSVPLATSKQTAGPEREGETDTRSLRSRDARVIESEFSETFWPAYPNKVGKPKAMKAFAAARRRAELGVIMDGLRRYAVGKPEAREWLNPATFLNQDRWADVPASPNGKANGNGAGNGNGHAPIDWVERAEQYHRLGDRWAPFWEPYEMVPAEYRHLFGDLFAGAAT